MTAARPTYGAKTLAELARATGGSDASRTSDEHPARPALVPDPDSSELVRGAVAGWRASLVDLAGGSSLADVGLLGDAVLDLSGAHPSGLAQLFAGRPTRLSNIFRETSGAMPAARRRARAVAARSAEYGQTYGVPATYLAIGVATWSAGSPTPEADDVVALARVTDGGSDGAAQSPRALIVQGPEQDDVPYDAADEDGADRSAALEVVGAPGAAENRADGADADPEDAEREHALVPRVVHAPVLLRPITVTPLGDGETDYELLLEPTAEINPLLARTLRSHGALLDPVAVARSTFSPSGFEPGDALARLGALGEAVLEDFELGGRILVGAFVHPGQLLVDDLDEIGSALERHEVVGAVAGVAEALNETLRPAPGQSVSDGDPANERGVGDLDRAQRAVLATVAAGGHLFVDAPSGSDVPGTVAALVADAAAHGRNVLYVPGHRRAADAMIDRLTSLGLEDLVLDVPATPTWRGDVADRLLGAMAREPEPGPTPESEQEADALVGARSRLAGYIDALHLVRDPWHVSAYDALQALARLSSSRPTPSTAVRLPPAVVLALRAERRAELRGDLEELAELGAFTDRARRTPWAGADIVTDAAARAAMLRVRRLVGQTLPRVRQQVAHVATTTGLEPARTVAEWSSQLTMLGGMRGTLDVFLPEVFERAATDLVNATATRQWRADHGVEMRWSQRRRLRKQAKDMVRPGVRVPDMHEALIGVAEQRAVWQKHCPRGGWPVLPSGLAAIEETLEAVRIDLEDLVPVLAGTTAGAALGELTFERLAARLEALAADPEALETLPRRTAVLRGVRDAGLGDLVDDLAFRRVPQDLVGAELELAWWGSVFEQLLAQDAALAGQDSAGLDALAARFRELDRRHVRALAGPVRAAVREQLGDVMREHREDAERLFTELIGGRLSSVRDTTERFPALARRLRPVVVATPTLVPHLVPSSRTVDLVVLDSVQHTPIEVLVAAIARGRQVVVLADPRTATGSAVAELSDVLARAALEPAPLPRDPGLTRFLVEHGYDGVLRAAPLPRAEPLVVLDLVDGRGMPDPVSGVVESTQAEVERVVEIAIEHALTRPEESFGIVAVTAVHAERIREALLAEVRANPALAPFFSGSRREPVVVAGLGETSALERDTVVLSLGIGRTPHGRVLHRFDVLNVEGGDRLLLGALAAARHRLRVVACFESSDLDPERLRGAGSKLLRELLTAVAERSGAADQVVLGNGVDSGPDRLVVDLAERLWRSGLVVETDYGTADSERIPLVVGHPDLPGELLVAVLTDDARYVAEPSVRVRDRQRAERLERLGWTVVQVWSAAAFLDPVKEAERIRRIVQQARDARLPRGQSVTGAVAVAPVVVDAAEADDDAALVEPPSPADTEAESAEVESVEGAGAEAANAETEQPEPARAELPQDAPAGASPAGASPAGDPPADES
ncbi:hypothetical protein [Cellulomonas sp. PhB143]|uniref:hypothetical protein n=1 Tax=Cellulomonas sp. PhB143 TaxID=2485186 RepID=UPI000F47D15E|nr:hypothetical protein [Cellulomonas sp. PhB143]ROS78728.1 hypothetical protein EDF32_0634 [Cellulomonas sp. PhB143]